MPLSIAGRSIRMTKPVSPVSLTFQQLKTLAWTMVPRADDTAALYASEAHAQETIKQAAMELSKVFTSPEGEQQITDDDTLALELVTILECYRPCSLAAARIMVDRYGTGKP